MNTIKLTGDSLSLARLYLSDMKQAVEEQNNLAKAYQEELAEVIQKYQGRLTELWNRILVLNGIDLSESQGVSFDFRYLEEHNVAFIIDNGVPVTDTEATPQEEKPTVH